MIQTAYQLEVITDLDSVSTAVMDFFHAQDTDFYPPISQRIEMHAYIASIMQPDGALIIASDADRVIGIVGLTFAHPRFRYFIQYVATDPSYRRQGIAHLLFDKAFALLQERGADRVTIRTWSANQRSQQLFTSTGFILYDKVFNDRGEGVHSYYFGKSFLTGYLKQEPERIGILGGMGSFSTGNFIKTLTGTNKRMQGDSDSLSFLLVNEPAIPDRSTSIRENKVGEMTQIVNAAIEKITAGGVSHLMLLCFTLHPFINRLKIPAGTELIDLVDFTRETAAQSGDKWMLAATLSSYAMDHFSAADIVLPREEDRQRIQDMISEIKTGTDPVHYKKELAAIAGENGCSGIVLGCTDLHGMYGYDKAFDGIHVLDPLTELAFMLESKRKAG
ncbi:GNAT family N-acetyltransferase [Sediminibacterium ginsengisoli]|uniref:Aspartate/glutamate racemase n=1 Tax=Sediminibacterium ginsengisoli TaxID=413434 RepID=A0A1T4PMY5_9BACT|nr:GNAT family N-acetyltransferase [Sediminibacterium ginsengisoli]SJZ92819.1 Aspartate/glutamate racemase [Sediminibacterium ginsengisoli]